MDDPGASSTPARDVDHAPQVPEADATAVDEPGTLLDPVGTGDENAAEEPSFAVAAGTTPTERAGEGDWLDRICPYLRSEDGTWRSTQPDPGHRCTAQDPPGTLPSAFQERFCLTDRHVRCEMYKFAQSARSAALEQEGIPAEQVQSARFRPSVRSVPLALGPTSERAVEGRTSGLSRVPLALVAAGIGVVAIIIIVLAFLLGGSGDPGPGLAGSPSPSAPSTAATPTPVPATPAASVGPDASPAGTDDPVVGSLLITYEVQEGERLRRIANTFGTTPQQILLANEGMADQRPYVEVGDIIIVPVSPDMPEEDITAAPGFVEFLQ